MRKSNFDLNSNRLSLGYERNNARFHNPLKSLRLIEIPIRYTNQARLFMCAMLSTLCGTVYGTPRSRSNRFLPVRASADCISSANVRHMVEAASLMMPTRTSTCEVQGFAGGPEQYAGPLVGSSTCTRRDGLLSGTLCALNRSPPGARLEK